MEYPLTLALVSLALAFTGAGRFSISHLLMHIVRVPRPELGSDHLA